MAIQFAYEVELNRSTSVQSAWDTYLSLNSILWVLNIYYVHILSIKVIILKGNTHLKTLFILLIMKKRNTVYGGKGIINILEKNKA